MRKLCRFKVMRTILLILPLLFGVALGDGIRMTKDHRFASKRETCHTLMLTVEQIAELEGKRKGEKPIYAKMKLTKEQAAFVKEKTGKEIVTVLVFEQGWQDCSCCAENIASRYKPDRVEITSRFLVNEAELRRREAKWNAMEKEKLEKKKAAEAALEAKKAELKAEREGP